MKKLNSNFVPVANPLANIVISGAIDQLALTGGSPIGGGGGAGATVLGIVTRGGATPANISLVAGTLPVLNRQGSNVTVTVG